MMTLATLHLSILKGADLNGSLDHEVLVEMAHFDHDEGCLVQMALSMMTKLLV